MPSDLIRGWKPVRVKRTRQIKNLEPRSDSIGTETALAVAAMGFLGAADKGAAPVVDRRQALDVLAEVGKANPKRGEIDRLRQTLRFNSERPGIVAGGRAAARIGAADDDQGTGIARAHHGAANFDTVAIGEFEIEDHAVEAIGLQMADRLAARARDRHLELGTAGRPLQQFLLHDIIIDDE